MRIDARLLPLVLAVLFSTQLEVAGQSVVKGYYVTIDSQRFEGFIRVDAVDSRDSPWKFHYRAVSDVNAREVNVNDVRELGLNDGTVFRRLTVEMTGSPLTLTNCLSTLNAGSEILH
jgi:phosphomevalonate kinase